MDLDAVIKDLKKRREVLDEAIGVFERLVEADKREKAQTASPGRPSRKAKRGLRKKSADA